MIQPGHCTHRSRRGLIRHLVFFSGINADLVDLFLPGICLSLPGQQRFYLETSPCDFHMRQPVSLMIS